MKNVLKSSWLVLMLLLNGSMEAAEDLDVKVANNKILIVELGTQEPGAVLLLQSQHGEILYRDSLPTFLQYKKRFDLEVVPNGIYYLNLDLENSIQTTMIVKTEKGLEIKGSTTQIVFKPTYEVGEKQVKVFMTNPEKKTASFKVFDSKGVLVGTVNDNNYVVKRILDFSGVPAGEYTIQVKTANHTFFRKVSIS